MNTYEEDVIIRRGARRGAHSRWHVGRGVVNLDCQFCREERATSEPSSDKG